MVTHILITDPISCTAHYLIPTLLENEDYQLHLLVDRDMVFKVPHKNHPQVSLIEEAAVQSSDMDALIPELKYIIHLSPYLTEEDKQLFHQAAQHQLEKIIYFSTASLLNEHNELDPVIKKDGNALLQKMYQAYSDLKNQDFADKVYTIFPTLLLGGDQDRPDSPATRGLKTAIRHMTLLKYLTVDASFHYIHAHDLSIMAKHIMENDVKNHDFVAGNPLISAEETLHIMCRTYHQKRGFKMDITQGIQKYLPVLLPGKLSRWDVHCLKKRHFWHQVTSPASFGLETPFKYFEKCLPPPMK